MLTEQDVREEVKFAKAKHGPFPKDHLRAHLHMSEEVGEVAEALELLVHTPRLHERRPERVAELRRELVQVVACCSMWVANLDMEAEHDKTYSVGSGVSVGERGEGDGGGGAVRTKES